MLTLRSLGRYAAICAGISLLSGCAPTPIAVAKPEPNPVPAPAPAPPPPVASDTTYVGLGATSVPSERIAAYAPPPIDASITGPIAALLDVSGVDGGAVTADGKTMFFTWRITGVLQVWRQDGPGRFPVQLTGGRASTTLAQLSPDDSFLVISRDHDGQENPGLYLQAPEGGPLTKIFHKPGVQAFHGFVSDDARYVYYRTNEARPDAFAIYRFDRKTQQNELVFDEPGLWSIQDYRGDEVLLSKALGNTQNEIWSYDLGRKTLEPRLGQGVASQWSARFGAAAGELLVLTDDQADRKQVWAYRPGQPRRLISPAVPHEAASVAIDNPRRRIYIVMNEGGYFKLSLLDAKSFRTLPLPKLPAHENAWGGGTTPNGRFVTFAVDSARLPAVAVVHDWQTGKTTQWRTPSLPEVSREGFVAPALEHYPARDGTQVPMLVYRPAACAAATLVRPCPVIVNFHGGPEAQARPGFSAFAQIFVQAGFILVQPNVRGSTGYGKAWLDADNGPRRRDVVTDIEDCALHLRQAWQRGGVAPKLGVFGASYGGYSTLMAMTYFAGSYDAGVSSVGISNLATFLTNTAPYRQALRVSEYGDPAKDAAALRELSPMTHVAKLRGPLLLIQGVNDPRVPVGEAMQFYDTAHAAGAPISLILFADEGHGTAKRENQIISLGHTIGFFRQHLQ